MMPHELAISPVHTPLANYALRSGLHINNQGVFKDETRKRKAPLQEHLR